MGMILTINTNGTLLGESWADFFAEYRPRRINITLYGADAASYSSCWWWRAVKACFPSTMPRTGRKSVSTTSG